MNPLLQRRLAPAPRSILVAEHAVNGFFGRITTARTTDLWLPDASGVYQQYGNGEVGIVDGDAVWCQPAATNLITRSEEFDNAAWTKDGVTISADAANAPDGTATADKLVESSGGTNHRAYIGPSNSVVTTFSFFAKKAERNWVTGYFSGLVSGVAYFDLDNGVVGTVNSNVSASIEAYADGWYRCIVTKTVASSHNFFIVALTDQDNNLSYSGDGSSGAFFWGAQAEVRAFATSYIPTAGSAVTINATEPKFTTVNPTTNFSGSFIWKPAAASQGTIWLLGNYTDANNAWGVLHDGTNVIFRNRVSGTDNDATKALAYAADTEYLIHFRHDTVHGLDIAVDRVKGTNDSTTTAVTNATDTYIGQDGNDASHMTGSMRDIRIQKHAVGWSDSEWLA